MPPLNDNEELKSQLDTANIKIGVLELELLGKYHETASYLSIIADKDNALKTCYKIIGEKIEVIGKMRDLLYRKAERDAGTAVRHTGSSE